ncbi:peptidase S8/S53 domain-containing protein [Kalaharituber pfeilii]|nr:peptidase S8/S53 domain-containing protein [Kalaharituber pfeilii]
MQVTIRWISFAFVALLGSISLCAASLIPGDADISSAADIIPGKYIITLSPKAPLSQHLRSISKRDTSIFITQDFNIGSFKGYAADIAFPADVSHLTSLDEVLSVEPDRVVRVIDDFAATKTLDRRALVTQTPISNWGLGRISHVARGATNYIYDESAGANTWAYIVDTGINDQHVQFAVGRASQPGYGGTASGTTADGNGHGTAVAGIIAGTRDGVAKKAFIIPVKVLDDRGAGTVSSVIAGTQWAFNHASSNGRLSKSVLHFSLGGGYSAALNNAVTSAVNGGLMAVVAAGSSNSNAANYSPASAAGAFVVGASASNDVRASFSNYGSIVSVYAPGQSITTTYIGSSTATITLNGTTCSAAFVSGVALYLMRLFPELTTPAAVAAKVLDLCTPAGSLCILYNGSGY